MCAQFHGTPLESEDFDAALARWCECKIDDQGNVNDECVVCRMKRGDQRALDGLLFMRRMVERLRRQEQRQ